MADCRLIPARPIAVSSSAALAKASPVLSTRVRKLEQTMKRFREDLQAQAQEVVGIATGHARTDNRLFIQNSITAMVHFAKTHDDGHTMCGWRFATVRRHGLGPPSRILHDLIDIPGAMICEQCLPTERTIAHIVLNVDLSGDES